MDRASSTVHMWLLTTLAAALGGTMPSMAQTASGDAAEPAVVYFDYADESGELSGGRIEMLVARPDAYPYALRAEVTTIHNSGPAANRIDIVMVGDGYTAAELGTYALHAVNWLAGFLAAEPFHSYSHHFNVHRVDVASNESGVDHDPTYPIWRDTALDMGFFCGGMDRLLCVDVGKAYAYANSAPDVDEVLAMANSSKYGGAGYPSEELATFASANYWATEIALHEFGHSLGDLADEYDYADGARYSGPELPEPNASILNAAQMAAAGTKWAAWLGTNRGDYDGLQSTYEGAVYYQYGAYRASTASRMRSLGRPFNLPSAEATIIEIYKLVRPIDAATPNAQPLSEHDTISVTLVQPATHTLNLRWYLDGEQLPGATGTSLNLATLSLASGTHTVSVEVVDPTDLVRNEAARQQWLRQTRAWTVEAGAGDLNCDGLVNFDDINPFVLALTSDATYRERYPHCRWLNADVNGDGLVDFTDINPFVSCLVAGGCP